MKRGDETWLRLSTGEVARFAVHGTTQHGATGKWVDGPLEGREAAICKEAFVHMATAAKGGRTKLSDMDQALALDREKLEGIEPGSSGLREEDLAEAFEDADALEAKRAAARERVRAWRAAKKAAGVPK